MSKVLPPSKNDMRILLPLQKVLFNFAKTFIIKIPKDETENVTEIRNKMKRTNLIQKNIA